jgi:hypothetical protein
MKHSVFILLFLLKLAAEVIHNMRTIKQLSIEKEVLRQYSELIHKILQLVFRILHIKRSSIDFIFIGCFGNLLYSLQQRLVYSWERIYTFWLFYIGALWFLLKRTNYR